MLILASASPRRQQILKKLDVDFKTHPVDIDETPVEQEDPIEYVRRLAYEKAMACRTQRQDDLLILASDTTVAIEGEILGKPMDANESKFMLNKLSNKVHQVHTAFCLLDKTDSAVIECVSSDVEFVQLEDHEIEAYWQTGEPKDKAGSYGIQGIGGSFVKRVSGSFSAVVGLPEQQVLSQLRQHGIKTWIEKSK